MDDSEVIRYITIQFGEVIRSSGRSRKFSITCSVRQVWVLRPRLFPAVLQFLTFEFLAFELSVNLQFADEIAFFPRSAIEAGKTTGYSDG